MAPADQHRVAAIARRSATIVWPSVLLSEALRTAKGTRLTGLNGTWYRIRRAADLMDVRCPACHGTARNPEAPVAIADDDGTCLVCCFPSDPHYAAHHGYIRSRGTPEARRPLSKPRATRSTGGAGR